MRISANNADSKVVVAIAGEHEPELLAALLQSHGHETTVVATGEFAFEEIRTNTASLLIVDAQNGGFELQQKLNSRLAFTGLLFVGDQTTSSDQRVLALANGADDFITRPFSPTEFVERVRAILRRIRKTTDQTLLHCGGLEINVSTHEVRRDGMTLALTVTEFRLLHYLVSNSPRVLSKRQIVEQIWGYDFDGDFNVVETFISYLRKKIDVGTDSLIRTVRGVGYAVSVKAQPLKPNPVDRVYPGPAQLPTNTAISLSSSGLRICKTLGTGKSGHTPSV